MESSAADTTPTGPRSRGRELAVLALCHLERFESGDEPAALQLLWTSPPAGDEPGEDSFVRLARDEAARGFADALVSAWIAHRAEVDEAITASSRKWRLERMDRVDRNVLRLATAELTAQPQTPRGVVLSEAVRIARRYGSEHSPKFVNGLLDAIAKRAEEASRTPAT
jgi:N utilization substance protein B